MTFTLTIFLAFHNLFMMLVHMEVHSEWHILMWIQSKFQAGWHQNLQICFIEDFQTTLIRH